MLIQRPALKPEIIFLIVALVFGITFALITPMFQVNDEGDHYLKVTHLSQGQVFVKQSKVFITLYSPIPYLIPTLAFFIGKILGLSAVVIFYIGRLSNLFLYILIVFLAIKYTPILKWVFFALALMPMALYEAASLSSDGFNIAISFLLIAYILKLAFDDKIPKINKDQYLIVLVLGLMLALSKEIYVLSLLLFLIIPKQKFINRNFKYTRFFIIFVFSISAALLWGLLVKGLYVPMNFNINPQEQISFILTHLITFIWILIATISQNLLFYLTSFVGTFGWKDIGLDTSLSPFLVYLYILFVFFVALTDKIEVDMQLRKKLFSITLFLVSLVSIFILEYLTWTTVGNNLIDGVYGRYLIPIAPLLFLGFYNKQIPNFKGNNILVPCFIIIMLFISVFMIYHRFY
ncbi:MAG: DUF2142 domain-containing protein [Methanobacterium sp. ERen5]|nr:MAG: DUF2142 domain-containing protein [Methanobacterium sp. ERen5]